MVSFSVLDPLTHMQCSLPHSHPHLWIISHIPRLVAILIRRIRSILSIHTVDRSNLRLCDYSTKRLGYWHSKSMNFLFSGMQHWQTMVYVLCTRITMIFITLFTIDATLVRGVPWESFIIDYKEPCPSNPSSQPQWIYDEYNVYFNDPRVLI